MVSFSWSVRHWTATMEANASGSRHLHLMLQFNNSVDCATSRFAFEAKQPNASSHDYLGEGVCKKKLQQSIDRGMFYVWANKVGTVQVGGCQLRALLDTRYPLVPGLGQMARAAIKQRKLSTEQYEECLYLTRDGVLARKRNLDAVKEHEAALAEAALIAANTHRVRTNAAVYRPFPPVPAAQAWLAMFCEDRLRYPLLLVLGASHTGKTEWVKSLFKNFLDLKVGSLEVFPDGMRGFERDVHDGIILDDVRDLAFLAEHQDKVQGKYDTRVEFATTPGGTCAFRKYLFAVPIAVTVNYSTRNLDYLQSHDWLMHEGNRVLVHFPDVFQQS